jgi:cysteine desulfurase/selenocysteine lyase
LIDAAQLIAHKAIDVQDLDCDFLAFSGHKIFGPDGIGVLYAKRKHLEAMPPFLGGGSMIRTVTKDGFSPADPPQRFEAGTPPVAQAVGLAAALEWLGTHDRATMEAHESQLMKIALEQLQSIPGVRIVGSTDDKQRVGNLSFTVDGIHAHDIAQLMGDAGICIRAGNHCAQILHDELKITASARISFAPYNTEEEVRRIAPALQAIINKLSNPHNLITS